jgi:hypothetical protein
MKYKSSVIVLTYKDASNDEDIPFPAITINHELETTKEYLSYMSFWRFQGYSAYQVERFLNFRNNYDEFVQTLSVQTFELPFFCSYFTKAILCNVDYVMTGLDSKRLRKIDDFVGRISNSTLTEWFVDQKALWNSHYKPEFVEVLTKRGYGFAFNMLPSSKLFTDELDFRLKIELGLMNLVAECRKTSRLAGI